MVSVNTNVAAMTALRTLQNTNKDLDSTQNRVSTGYKIGEAKDNAAYWSISTTLKSDNKSLSTVKDALGLGASTVDTAYQGLNKAKDVLDEIKSKLTAATQDGVNRDTIQNEIKQLQDQLTSIATSSVFSGENWLSVDSSATSYNANKQVVSSFSRDASGSVSIGKIDVNTKNVALFDSSMVAGSGGIIDGAVKLKGNDGRDLDLGTTNTGGNTSNAGLSAAVGSSTGLATGTAMTSTTTGAVAGVGLDATGAATAAPDAVTMTIDAAALAVGQKISLSYVLNGVAGTKEYTVATARSSAADVATDLAAGLDVAGALVVTNTTTALTITAANNNQELTITDFRIVGSNTKLSSAGFTQQSTAASMTSVALNSGNRLFTAGSGITTNDKVQMVLSVDGATVTTGAIARGADVTTFAASLNADANFAAKAYASVTSNGLTITSLTTGVNSKVELTSVAFYEATTGKAKTPLADTGLKNVAVQSTATTGTFAAMTLDDDDNLYFSVKVDDSTAARTVTINKALIDTALKDVSGHVSGKIADINDYKKVMDAALTAAGISGLSTAIASQTLVFSTASYGTASKLTISDVMASAGADTVSVDKIDISASGLSAAGAVSSDDVKAVLKAYIEAVNTAITKVTSAAASLGSVASRIELQSSFVNTLMDTINKGVGNLVDADMSEESTKLQALQVKQQLGVQALSIANSSQQNILSLFRQ